MVDCVDGVSTVRPHEVPPSSSLQPLCPSCLVLLSSPSWLQDFVSNDGVCAKSRTGVMDIQLTSVSNKLFDTIEVASCSTSHDNVTLNVFQLDEALFCACFKECFD